MNRAENMSFKLGLTGMDQATESALKAAFNQVAEQIREWSMVAENDADYIIVDMDSMYGPMSWLRLHAAGKQVIALTSASRTQADFLLPRPFDARQLGAVLGEIGGGITEIPTVESAPVVVPTPEPVRTPEPAPPPAVAALAPIAPPPPPPPVAVAASAPPAPPAVVAAPPAPAPPAPAPPAPATPPAPVAVVPAAAQPEEPAAQTARSTAFAHWLRPGGLTGRARFQSGKGPELFIDFAQRQYFGPATLKPLAEYFVANVGLRDFEQLDDQAWQSAVASLGEAQPLARLQWFGGLLAGKGKLLPGFDPDDRFVLSKWPQTEREYPRHFRIATTMMKGLSTIAQITAASSVPAADVIDFINANLATGFAEPSGDGGKSGGLLDRLRGR